MRTLVVGFAIALAVGPAAASDKSEKAAVMAAVNQFNDGMNNGDTKTATTACASPVAIVRTSLFLRASLSSKRASE